MTTTAAPTTAPATTTAGPVPIIEQIATDLQSAINEITEDNGWDETLVAVRPTRIGFEDNAQPEDLKVLIIQDDAEFNAEVSSQGNAASRAWWQSFSVIAFVINDDTSTDAIDTRMNYVASDIQKKVMEDPYRSGLALDTRIAGTARFAEGPAFSGIAINVEILYRTREDDPYELA